MTHGFPELPVGGLLVAPFVPQALIALVIFLLTAPLRQRLVKASVFANPSLAQVCLFVVTIAVVMLFY